MGGLSEGPQVSSRPAAACCFSLLQSRPPRYQTQPARRTRPARGMEPSPARSPTRRALSCPASRWRPEATATRVLYEPSCPTPPADRGGGSLELHTGGYGTGDGGTYTVSGNAGLPLGRTGFANLSVEYGNAGRTSRSVQRDDAALLIAAGNDAVADPAQIWGSPRIDDNVKLWGHFGHLFASGVQAYGHANYASRRVASGFFFRNPNTRAAVFSADRGQSLLIGDALDARDGIPDGSAGPPRGRRRVAGRAVRHRPGRRAVVADRPVRATRLQRRLQRLPRVQPDRRRGLEPRQRGALRRRRGAEPGRRLDPRRRAPAGGLRRLRRDDERQAVGTLPARRRRRAVFDLEAAYTVSESTTLTIGGQNVFANDPEANPIARAKGNRFSAHTPFGVNGGFYYVRINYGWKTGG